MSIKISPQTKTQDICHTSIRLLKSSIQNYFSYHRSSLNNPWFADDSDWSQLYKNSERIKDVVYFGNFLLRFLESGNWPEGDFRFWCLSHSVRDVLTQLIKIPQDKVGLINRNHLFNKSPLKKRKLRLNEPLSLVYAGRISPGKNIEALIYLTLELQKRYHREIKLYLIGSFDNIPNSQWGRFDSFCYRSRIKETIENINWPGSRPTLLDKQDPEQWMTINDFVQPCFISLSTSISDDFGLAAQQAHKKGWPLILSNWGGHLDLNGEQIYYLDWNNISQHHENTFIIQQKSKILASQILCQSKKKEASTPPPFPTVINSHEIDQIRKEFIYKWKKEAKFLTRGRIDIFADTTQGKHFFSLYRSYFSKPINQQYWMIITKDTSKYSDHINDDLKNHIEAIYDQGKKVPSLNILLSSYQEILSPEYFVSLNKVSKVFTEDTISNRVFQLKDLFTKNTEIIEMGKLRDDAEKYYL